MYVLPVIVKTPWSCLSTSVTEDRIQFAGCYCFRDFSDLEMSQKAQSWEDRQQTIAVSYNFTSCYPAKIIKMGSVCRLWYIFTVCNKRWQIQCVEKETEPWNMHIL